MRQEITRQATTREVGARFMGYAGTTAFGFGAMKVLPEESGIGALLALVGLGAILVGVPWMQEAIVRLKLWRNTRGYSADE